MKYFGAKKIGPKRPSKILILSLALILLLQLSLVGFAAEYPVFDTFEYSVGDEVNETFDINSGESETGISLVELSGNIPAGLESEISYSEEQVTVDSGDEVSVSAQVLLTGIPTETGTFYVNFHQTDGNGNTSVFAAEFIIAADEEAVPMPTPEEEAVDPIEEEPTEESSEPTEEPAEPTEESAEPTEEPAEPTEEPAEPTEEPAEPTEEPAEPTEKPAEPTEEPAEPTEEPAEPTEEPAEPTEEPAEPTEEPAEPTEEPAEPTEEPAEPTEEPAESTEEPETTEKPTTEPTEEPDDEEDEDDDDVPQTGESNTVKIMLIVLGVAVLGIVIALIAKRRRS